MQLLVTRITKRHQIPLCFIAAIALIFNMVDMKSFLREATTETLMLVTFKITRKFKAKIQLEAQDSARTIQSSLSRFVAS